MELKFITNFIVTPQNEEHTRMYNIDRILDMLPKSFETNISINYTIFSKIQINDRSFFISDTEHVLKIVDNTMYNIQNIKLTYYKYIEPSVDEEDEEDDYFPSDCEEIEF